MATKKIKVTLDFERETKNTYRFMEDSDTPVLGTGTLYVSKSAFDVRPDTITVTVEASAE